MVAEHSQPKRVLYLDRFRSPTPVAESSERIRRGELLVAWLTDLNTSSPQAESDALKFINNGTAGPVCLIAFDCTLAFKDLGLSNNLTLAPARTLE